MKNIRKCTLKASIVLSNTFEEADAVINEYMGFESIKEKIAFLKGMFDVEILAQKSTDSDELVYNLLLSTIISKNI